MRMVTAATHWKTTCSVTPAMSRGWRKDPHLQPSTSTTSSQRHSGEAGPGLPREVSVGYFWGPPEEEGQEVKFLLVCEGYLSFHHSSVHSPSSTCIFQVLFPIAIPSPNHSGRCSNLHMAHDTRLGLCNWTHPSPWK